MLTGYDSTNAWDLPPGGNFYLGYIDGEFANYAQVQARFPASKIVSVTVNGSVDADMADTEPGNLPVQSAAAGLLSGRWKAIYSDESDYNQLIQIIGKPFPWFAADPTGEPHIVPASFATQWAWPGKGSPGHYDISAATDLNVFFPPYEPLPHNLGAENMIAHNSHGKGFWAVRPSGDVYAYDGAPYLGPAPRFLSAWGIGAQAGVPIVGIADNGDGSYVLCADNGQYPGQPALYRITPDGQYAK